MEQKKHPEHLKWMHRLISKFEAFVLGTFHRLDSCHKIFQITRLVLKLFVALDFPQPPLPLSQSHC
jgi:hypothetical protein